MNKPCLWLYNSYLIFLNYTIWTLFLSLRSLFLVPQFIYPYQVLCYLCLYPCFGTLYSISESSRTKTQNSVGNDISSVWFLPSYLPYKARASKCWRNKIGHLKSICEDLSWARCRKLLVPDYWRSSTNWGRAGPLRRFNSKDSAI